MNRFSRTLLCLLMPALAGVSSAATSVVADTQELAVLRSLPSRSAGWKEDTTRFKAFDRTSIFTIIDGGAPDYLDNGLIAGCVEELSGPDSASGEVFIEDFGKAGAAAAMLSKKSGTMSERLPGFQKAEAAAEKVIGGCFACACFGRWYFEISMTGYTSFEKSAAAASNLLAAFKKKSLHK